jgi:O-antigen/teichoic acid export membrane protein
MIDTKDNLGNRENITDLGRGLILADAYAMLTIAYLAVALLYLLVRTILRGEVFGKKTVRLLAAVSWCCFAEGALVVLLTVWFQLAAVVALAACFVGLCLRVVKNVIEEATRIKAENDFTI